MSTESAVKHTPGSWRVRETPESSNQDFVVEAMHGGRTNAIASIDYQNYDGEAEANARLIAAAPAMLEALEGIAKTLDLLAPCPEEILNELQDRAEAVIRLAKGEL